MLTSAGCRRCQQCRQPIPLNRVLNSPVSYWDNNGAMKNTARCTSLIHWSASRGNPSFKKKKKKSFQVMRLCASTRSYIKPMRTGPKALQVASPGVCSQMDCLPYVQMQNPLSAHFLTKTGSDSSILADFPLPPSQHGSAHVLQCYSLWKRPARPCRIPAGAKPQPDEEMGKRLIIA